VDFSNRPAKLMSDEPTSSNDGPSLTRDQAMREFRDPGLGFEQSSVLTRDPLRSNRNAMFWIFHSVGWASYAITQYFGALLFNRPTKYIIVIATATLSGFLFTLPFRYVFRRLWGQSPQVIVIGVLTTVYVTALPVRALINLSFEHFVEPMWDRSSSFSRARCRPHTCCFVMPGSTSAFVITSLCSSNGRPCSKLQRLPRKRSSKCFAISSIRTSCSTL
jgi:hypothetical protein